jgi:hypothetical protein
MSLPILDLTPFVGRDDHKRPIESSAEGTSLVAALRGQRETP